MLKINLSKSGYKKVIRYFQVTKTEFKYYNSVFSSSVWNDKPLFRVKLSNVETINISNDDMLKIKFQDVKFAFQLFLNVNSDEVNNDNKVLEFGCEDPDIGISCIKVLMLIKQIMNKSIC